MSVAITRAPFIANQQVSVPNPEPVSSTVVPSSGPAQSIRVCIGPSN